jgi:hypothetical protein
MNDVDQVDPNVIVRASRFASSPLYRHGHKPMGNEDRFRMNDLERLTRGDGDAKRPKGPAVKDKQKVAATHTALSENDAIT